MRRVSGIDLNGWQDVAARDWDPEEPDERLPEPLILDGGVRSVAITQLSGECIGGPQALLAPHGRGKGWGLIGAENRRVSIAEICDAIATGAPDVDVAAYAAAVDALTRDAEDVIITVPDHSSFDEAAQGRVLALFRRVRRVHRLLWRPVALFLDALERQIIPADADGAKFRFLIHCGDGIEVQTLRLRKDKEHHGHVAPERDGYGSKILPQFGLRQLDDHAHAAVLQANPLLADGRCERSTLAIELLFGRARPGDTQILRHDNGNWFDVIAPGLSPETLLKLEHIEHVPAFEDDGEPVSGTFFVTPLTDRFARPLVKTLEQYFGRLETLDWSGTARGALFAGRLIERGLPHYFDRLTPIHLAVLRGDEPRFEDLVGSGATLPANREYVSPPYRDLKWLRGKTEIDFYVLKGDTEVRHWQVALEGAPPRDLPVELRLRQTPGQSWAKLSLTSSDWEPLQRNPIFLDWANLTPDDRTPAEVLEQLRTPPPTIPERVVEQSHDEFWRGSNRLEGISMAVRQMKRSGRLDPDRLAKLLSRSLRDPVTGARFWPVGTDGTLPGTLSSEEKADFTSILDALDTQIQRASVENSPTDNHRLRCLTWTFTLCPEATQQAVVEALEADTARKRHALLMPNRARTVLTQGAGRSITGVEKLKRVLTILVSRPANTDTLNALAMILSRREEAPQALTGALVDKLAKMLSQELVQLTSQNSFSMRFRNALLALAGLFRYREVERYALLAGRDPLAQTIRTNLDEVSWLLDSHKRIVRQYPEKKRTIDSIREFLDGGGDPNILLLIEDLTDDDENDQD
jgi:hypothetical protein